MPTVPKYEGLNVANNVSPNVQFNTNAPAEAFGGGRAAQQFEAARELGNVGFQIAQKARQDADDVAFAEYASQLKRQRIDLELNKETGVLNRKGKDAFNLQQEAEEGWKKRTEELIAQAPNDRVKERLSRVALAEGDSLFQAVQGHVSRELRAHDEAVSKALTETAVNDAILNKDNPEAYQNNLAIARDTIEKYVARNGMDGVEKERLLNSTLSRAHAMAITQYLDSGQDRVAKAHFEKYGDQIKDAEVRGQIEKSLEAGSHLGEVTRVADEIILKTNDMGTAMSLIKQIEDPKIRKDAQAMVMQQLELKRRAEDDRSERNMDQQLRQLEQTRGLYDLPVSMRTAMKTEHIKAFEQRKEQLLSGTSAPPNGQDFYNLRMMAAMPETKDDFLKKNLLVYAAKMPPNELSKLIEIQADLRNNTGKSDKMLGQFRTQNEVINSVLIANKIDVSPKPGSDDAVMVERMRTKVEEDAVRYAQETGKAPTNADIQRFAENYMIQVTTDKVLFWDIKKRRIDLAPDEKGSVQYKDIPKTRVSEVEAALRRKNMAVTPQAVEKLFNAYIEKSGK
jgi:hypothetical protein